MEDAMSQTFYKLWVHLVWGTKELQPSLHKEIRGKVLEHIKDKAIEEGYHIDTINGVANHIHCLISLQPRFAISEVMNKLKGESSHWINEHKLTHTHFSWQGGFAAFSVSESDVGKVREYILNQEGHHRKKSFTEEVEELFKQHNAIQMSKE
jgi:REP element-mobilizing transposase RayT